MTIPSLAELSIKTFLNSISRVGYSDVLLEKELPSHIHHLICQTVLDKIFCREGRAEGYHLKVLYCFSDPYMLETRPIKELSSRGEFSALQIVEMFLSIFPNLKKLDLSDTGISLNQVKSSESIVELVYKKHQVHNKGPLKVVFKDKWPHLKKLEIKQIFLTDLRKLEGLRLEELVYEGSFDSSDYEYGANFDSSETDSSVVEVIGNTCPTLKKLTLCGRHQQDDDSDHAYKITSLKGLEGVEELGLTRANIVDLEGLEGLQRLKKLNLNFSKIKSLKKGKSLSLEELTLKSCNLSAEEFENIKDSFPCLKRFISDMENIHSIKGLEGLLLEELDIEGCQLPSEEWLKIKDQFPHLKKLYLKNTNIDSSKGLEGLPLEELNLNGCRNLSEKELSTIKAKFPHLKKSD